MTSGDRFGKRVRLRTQVRRVVMQSHSSLDLEYGDAIGERTVKSAKARYEWRLGQDAFLRFHKHDEPADGYGFTPYTEVPLVDGHIPEEYRPSGVHWPGFPIPLEWGQSKVIRKGWDPDQIPPVPRSDWGGRGAPWVMLCRFPMELAKGVIVGRVRRFEGIRTESDGHDEDFRPGYLQVHRMVPLYVVALQVQGLPSFRLVWEEDLVWPP